MGIVTISLVPLLINSLLRIFLQWFRGIPEKFKRKKNGHIPHIMQAEMFLGGGGRETGYTCRVQSMPLIYSLGKLGICLVVEMKLIGRK